MTMITIMTMNLLKGDQRDHNFISIVSDTTDVWYENKFLKHERKSKISNLQAPGDLNKISVKEEADELMSDVSDPVGVIGAIDRLI